MAIQLALGMALSVAAVGFAGSAAAAEVSIPHTFTAGSQAKAGEVNANFTAAKAAVDDNDGRIDALEIGLSDASGEIDEVEDRVEALEALVAVIGRPGGETVSVDCGAGESVQAALDGGAATVNITGACIENLTVLNSGTSLLGSGGASIQADRPARSVVLVSGAQNVTLSGLTLSGAVNNGGEGLALLNGAQAILAGGMQITGNSDGALVDGHSSLDVLPNNNISGNSDDAVIVSQGSSLDVRRDNTIEVGGNNGQVAINALRNSTVRLRGGNIHVLSAGTGNRNYAIYATDGSTVSQDTGFVNLVGNSEATASSVLDFKHVQMDGKVNATRNSTVAVRSSGANRSTILKNITANGASTVELQSTDVSGGRIQLDDASSLKLNNVVVSMNSINVNFNSALRIVDGAIGVLINAKINLDSNAAMKLNGGQINGNIDCTPGTWAGVSTADGFTSLSVGGVAIAGLADPANVCFH